MVDNTNGLTVVGVSNTVTGATRLQASSSAGANALSLDAVNGTVVTGPTSLNGTLAVTGNSSLNGAVNNIGTAQASSNTIGTAGSNNTVVGSTRVVSSNGSSQVQVNDNGVSAVGDTVALHGRSAAQISGGSTRMNLNDNGVSFSNASGGAVRVTGVANGTAANDAVNVSQLTSSTNNINSRISGLQGRSFSGIASVAAMATIPEPTAGHNYTVGVGYGNFGGQNAVAFGGKANVGESVRVAASLGYAGSELTVGLGTGFSW
jgi:autotransporter adhesin